MLHESRRDTKAKLNWPTVSTDMSSEKVENRPIHIHDPPQKSFKLAPVFDCKVGMLKICLPPPPQKIAACARDEHTNMQCARGKVLSGEYL